MVFWVLSILLLLFLIACFFILNFQAQEVYKREEALIEAFWQRNHRIPLLLEVINRAIGEKYEDKIIELRARSGSEAYTIIEQLEFERELTCLIADVFRKNENNPELKSDALFSALEKEFQDLLEIIRVALNDYNFAVQTFRRYVSRFWFKIFEFAFEARKNREGPAL